MLLLTIEPCDSVGVEPENERSCSEFSLSSHSHFEILAFSVFRLC